MLSPIQAEVAQLRSNGLTHTEIGRILWPEVPEELAKKRSESTWSRARAKMQGKPSRYTLAGTPLIQSEIDQLRAKNQELIETCEKLRLRIRDLETDPLTEIVREALADLTRTANDL